MSAIHERLRRARICEPCFKRYGDFEGSCPHRRETWRKRPENFGAPAEMLAAITSPTPVYVSGLPRHMGGVVLLIHSAKLLVRAGRMPEIHINAVEVTHGKEIEEGPRVPSNDRPRARRARSRRGNGGKVSSRRGRKR